MRKTIKEMNETVTMYVEYMMNRVGVDIRDDEGIVSTEIAIALGFIGAAAVAVGVIVTSKMTGAAESIPDFQSPAAPGGG